MTVRPLFVLTLGLVCFGLAVAEEKNPSAARMLADVKYLASDELEGRGIGTKGLDLAAEYVANSLKQSGLKVDVAGGDPFQEFEVLDGAELEGVSKLALISPDGVRTELEINKDFEVCSFGDSGTFSGKLIFAGYGIESDEPKYNDFEDVDLTGAVVILMRRNPQQANPHGPFAVAHGVSRHAALSTKVSQAYARGAAAILFVNDPFSGRDALASLEEQRGLAEERVLQAADLLSDRPDEAERMAKLQEAVSHWKQVREQVSSHNGDPLMPFGYAGTRSGASVPVYHVTQASLNGMLSSALGKGLTEIEAVIDETGKPFSKEVPGWKAEGQTRVKVIRRPTSNVVGVLEGAGPFKDETIVIGAHFDHLGYGGEGSLSPGSMDIHNGADDNASGTAGLLELARRLSSRAEPLPRRVVFIAFSGEERGLLGSAEYVRALCSRWNRLWPCSIWT